MSDNKADSKTLGPKAPVELNDDEVAGAQAGTGVSGRPPLGRSGTSGITLDVESSDTIETVKQK